MTPGKHSKARVYVDGAARGNPGPASAGVVFCDEANKPFKSLSVSLGHATNNVAEYMALVIALQEAVLLGVKELSVFTDSELMARQWNGEYKIKDHHLKRLHALASHLKPGFKKLAVTHIPREQNKLADKEANRALDEGLLF